MGASGFDSRREGKTNRRKDATMTYEEMLKTIRRPYLRAKPGDEEHRLQVSCVRLFRRRYPQYAGLLFAVPNGGRRDAVTGARLKDEGVTAGVSDLILLKPNRFYGSLCIELKKPKGRQQPTQKEWQKAVEQAGNRYVLCRSVEEFMSSIDDYLQFA